MSTSDLTTGVTSLVTDAALPGSLDAASAGLPDPAVLTQLANEFFRAVPSAGQFDGLSPAVQGSVPAAATVVPGAQTPTEAELRALAATATQPAAPAAIGTVPAVPGIPGGFPAINLSSDPSFGFLQEARGLFNTAPAAPVNAVPMPAPLAFTPHAPLGGLPTTLPGNVTPTAPTSISGLAAPQVPGAPVHTADAERLASFDFLNVINPLEPFNGVPSVSPYTPDVQSPLKPLDVSTGQFDVGAIRRDFPILQERINGRQLIWLDNAATTQKPQAVIDRLAYFYAHENSNIHRAAHTLAARATDAYEGSREKVRRFLNAPNVNDIIFVRGATEAINLVAQSWGRRNIQKDDEIVVSILEHHANIVPWQMLCAEKGAKLRVAPVDNTGQILLDEYEKLLGPRTRLVAFTQVSNALGTVAPVAEMVEIAHRHGAKVLVDGAQAVSHMRVDVQEYDCDFYVFSGHKVFAPTGIGVVYGKSDVLQATPPWQGGGNMIADVTFEKTLYQPPPWRFEAGTGNIADAVGLGAAIDYLDRIGMANIARYEHDLLVYATDALQRIPGLHLIGTAREKASVLSFVLDGFKTEEVGTALNTEGIAVRSGHHCAQPILRRFGLESTVRPSLAFYNTCEEVDALVSAIWNLKNGRSPGLV